MNSFSHILQQMDPCALEQFMHRNVGREPLMVLCTGNGEFSYHVCVVIQMAEAGFFKREDREKRLRRE